MKKIRAKYGSLSGVFYHRGKGYWCKYSMSRDKKIKHKKIWWRRGKGRELHFADYRGKRGV